MRSSLTSIVLSLSALLALVTHAQQPTSEGEPLQRRYIESSVSHYVMTGDNEGRSYRFFATDSVRRDRSGHFYDEFSWFSSSPALTPASPSVTQTVSLDDPATYMKVPDLATTPPTFIGPILDTLTFYSDLLLALKAKLSKPGQTAYVSRATPNSWADGRRVLLGQDVIDFSLKLESVNTATHTATLLIEHVPPPVLHIQQPAKWMQELKPTVPNNFVQVSKEDKLFISETGHETFRVRLTLDTRDGRMISANMHNPVVLKMRTCNGPDLTQCGPETPKTIERNITFELIP